MAVRWWWAWTWTWTWGAVACAWWLPRAQAQPRPAAQSPARAVPQKGRQENVIGRDRGHDAVVNADGEVTFRKTPDERTAGDRIGDWIAEWHHDPAAVSQERILTVDGVSAPIVFSGGNGPMMGREQKRRILERTRVSRLHSRRAADQRAIAAALAELPGRLAAVWDDQARPVAERRRILFQLWDECREETDSGAPGTIARELIERFIARELPPGSPHAYSPAELAALNAARTSRRPFAPYPR
jgi:hypothetical protein